METVHLDLFKKIDEWKEYGKYNGDIHDSLNVASEMIVEKCKKLKFKRRIFLITDFIGKMKGDTSYIDTCKKLDIQLDIVSIKKGIIKEEKDPRNINEKKMERIIESLNGVIVPLTLAISSLYSLKSKQVSQRTSFRGLFEISKDLKIPIWMYKKTDKTSLPTSKKLSKEHHDIMIDKSYYSIDDPDQEVKEEDLIKAYKYGKSYIPFNSIDLKMLELGTEKSFQLIGFTEKENVQRQHFMASCYQIISEPYQEPSYLALSSLIKALAEMNKVAIVRYVFRSNSPPQLGVLLPIIKNNIYCFYYHQLPFAEDIRQYPFKSFEKIQHSMDQLEATEELIHSMNLEQENEELLKPSETFHPILQHFYECCHSKILYPEKDLPEMDEMVKKYCFPENSKESFYTKILQEKKEIFEKFQKEFPLEKIEKKEKKRYWFTMNEEEINLESYKKKRLEEEEVEDMERIQEKIDLDIHSSKTSNIGSKDPVKDFKEMIDRRDVDLFDKAIEQMQKMIIQFIHDSIQDEFYEKILQCLIELRKECLKEDEVEIFNNHLIQLKNILKKDLLNLMKKEKITFITREESDLSKMSNKEIEEYFNQEEKKKEEEVEKDDLFNEIE